MDVQAGSVAPLHPLIGLTSPRSKWWPNETHKLANLRFIFSAGEGTLGQQDPKSGPGNGVSPGYLAFLPCKLPCNFSQFLGPGQVVGFLLAAQCRVPRVQQVLL